MELKSYAELQKIHEHFESLFTKQRGELGKKQPKNAGPLLSAKHAKLGSKLEEHLAQAGNAPRAKKPARAAKSK